MRLGAISLRSGRTWWWLFALLIAAPALVREIYRIRVARTTGHETFSKGWGA